jgi:hypothetical protein
MKSIWCLLPVLWAFVACEHISHPPQPFEDLNAIGNQWVYQRFTSENNQTESMNVRITGDTNLLVAGKTARVWEFQMPDQTLFNYVLLENDTFQLFDYPDASRPIITIPMAELAVGHSWLGNYCTDTSRVVAYGSHTEQDIRHEAVWSIQRNAGFCVNWYMKQNIWWHNGIGFIRMERTDWTFGMPREEIWELVSFN